MNKYELKGYKYLLDELDKERFVVYFDRDDETYASNGIIFFKVEEELLNIKHHSKNPIEGFKPMANMTMARKQYIGDRECIVVRCPDKDLDAYIDKKLFTKVFGDAGRYHYTGMASDDGKITLLLIVRKGEEIGGIMAVKTWGEDK